jgi:hypothetical protein
VPLGFAKNWPVGMAGSIDHKQAAGGLERRRIKHPQRPACAEHRLHIWGAHEDDRRGQVKDRRRFWAGRSTNIGHNQGSGVNGQAGQMVELGGRSGCPLPSLMTIGEDADTA